jgi:hypothetical protein
VKGDFLLGGLLLAALLPLFFKPTRKWWIRWWMGEPVIGDIKHQTNATFLRWPSKIKHPRGRLVPHWWHWRPGWHRAAMRAAGVAVAAGLIVARLLVLALLAIAAVAVLVWAVHWLIAKARRWWPRSST